MEDNRHIKSTYSFYNHHVANREGGLSLVLAADTVCVCKEIEKRENTSYLYLSRYYQVAKIPHLMGFTCSNVKSPIYWLCLNSHIIICDDCLWESYIDY